MNLLVTGGAGFIGANFILYWLNKYPQDKIINFDKLTYAGNLENLNSVANNPNYQFIKGDICDSKQVDNVMQQVDTVVHFAAESHVDRSIMHPEDFIKTNIFGTFTLLEACRKKTTHFHHVSTDEVFGTLELGSANKFTLSSCYQPRSPYSASKAGSDHLVRSYFTTYKLPITISTCSNNYGPYQFPEKFIPLAITNLIEGKKIPIYGKGDQVRDWLHVNDHCLAIDLILKKGKTGQTYLVGGQTEDYSNLDVAKLILKFFNKDESHLEFVKDRPGHDVRYSIDWSETHKQIGYKPQHDFFTYLTDTINWYQQNQSWWQRIKSGEYQKYYHQQYNSRNIK